MSDKHDTALRILGAADAYAHVVVDLNRRIGELLGQRIDARHVRRLARRDEKLRPLVAMRDKYQRQMHECRAAYTARMEDAVQ